MKISKGAKLIILGVVLVVIDQVVKFLVKTNMDLGQQIYVLGCSPARDEKASYVAYGHSILTDPWGSVVCELGAEEGILAARIDLERVDSVRQQIPLRKE